jgi:tetratricopeptide (TPR) repeat protein
MRPRASPIPFDASLVATNLISASARSFAVSEPEPLGASQLDVDLMRQIDAVCRRFESDYRAGNSPVIADYLGDVPEVGRSALRSELIGLEQEMRQSDETSARPASGPIADVATIAPASLPTAPIPGLGNPSVHEEATVVPRDQATVDLGSSAPLQPDAPEPTRIRYFGDYEIDRELARGGMGIVFRARQISLNRPVALKMILAGQLADDTDVKRFYTEAEAAATLDHPGIVPIYEVGQHEGQHYFSMGFVEGQSLSHRLADGPLPPREAAELIRRVSEAIEFAHQHGVIHRDLKPANILLDKNGNPRVTDFGLAKKIASDSNLTGSGQIMGTPSFMPPEQAGDNRGDVGPAADVYALGATLYALVTGRPPFQAATAMDTVLQVLTDDPVQPRRLNPALERDLETIALTCLEKEPSRRYASAAALGEDLRRYLAGEPIVARPATSLERVVKWARRRPAIAALLGLVALGLVGLVGFTLVLAGKNRQLDDKNLQLAGKNWELDARNVELDRQRLRAEDREQQAIAAVKRFRDAIASEPLLKDAPPLEELRKRLLKEPLAFFRTLRQRLQAERDARPETLGRLAEANFELGSLTDEIGDKQDAIAAYRESLTIQQKLSQDHPSVASHPNNLAHIHVALGNLLQLTGQPASAAREYEQALAIWRKLADHDPAAIAYQRGLAGTHNNLGLLRTSTGQPAAAKGEYEQALAIWQKLVAKYPAVPEYESELAGTHNNLGGALKAAGQLEAARPEYEQAVAVLQKLSGVHPTVTSYQRDLAGSHSNLAGLLTGTGHLGAAQRECEQALAIQQKLVDAHPSVTRYQGDLADSHSRLAYALVATGQPEAARREYEQALAILEKLAREHPTFTQFQIALVRAQNNLGFLLGNSGQIAAARRAFEQALPIQQRLARENPGAPDFASDLGGLLNNLALFDLADHRFAEAGDELRQAIDWQKKALAANPRNPKYRQFLANHLRNRIRAARGLGRADGASAAERELEELNSGDPRFAALDARLTAVLGGDAARSNAERLALAQRAHDTKRHLAAAKLWAEALAADPHLAADRQAQHRYNAACAAALAATGKGLDEPAPDDAAKSRLRRQAHDWLKGELTAWERLLEQGSPQARAFIARTLQHWQQDTDLAGVRNRGALVELPGAELKDWQALWVEVDGLLRRAGAGGAARPAPSAGELPADPFAR